MPRLDGTASELECEDAIISAAQQLGYMAHAQRPAYDGKGKMRNHIKGDVGFPDLVIAGHGHLFVYELKSEDGEFRPGQREWLAALDNEAYEVHTGVLHVPVNKDAFIRKLQQIALENAKRRLG